jgi:hypothetical protein
MPIESVGYTPSEANFSNLDGSESHIDPPTPPTDAAASEPAAQDGVDPHPDGGVSSSPDGGTPDVPDGGSPPEFHGTPYPPPAPAQPPQQYGLTIGIGGDATVIVPTLSNGGGTVSGGATLFGQDGLNISGGSTNDQGSSGFSVGASAGVTVAVTHGTPSGPTDVYGGNLGPFGASVSVQDGAVGVTLAVGVGAPIGAYHTTTQSASDSGTKSPDDGLEAPDPIVPSISADSTDGRAY